MARTKVIKMIGGKHLQHTKEFYYEVNSPTSKKFNPFRISDEVWLIGKYKGIKLINTPVNYISWSISNMDISSAHLSILKEIENKLKNGNYYLEK